MVVLVMQYKGSSKRQAREQSGARHSGHNSDLEMGVRHWQAFLQQDDFIFHLQY